MDKITELRPVFFPKSIAVVGASSDDHKAGSHYLKALLAYGYSGKVFPVHTNETDVAGMKTYRSVRDIAQPVDLVNIYVPAKYVPGVIEDCVANGAAAAQIYSSGFREIGAEGLKLEDEIARLAGGKTRIIGPNCFGVYCPRGGITLLPGLYYPTESGGLAFVSQSGGLATDFIWGSRGLGVRFSKVVSYGNACDLDETDFLEYLRDDPDTKTITMYLEGLKNGKKFVELATELRGKKPLVIWKGGLTDSGARAVRTHTGSLAGEQNLWDALYKQAGAIKVNTIDELIDTSALFHNYPAGTGPRVALVVGGGGIGVAASDTCEQSGLEVPPLPDGLMHRIGQVLPEAGTGIRNPIDMGAPFFPAAMLKGVLDALMSWEQIDVIVLARVFFHGMTSLSGITDTDTGQRLEVLKDMHRKSVKPIAVVLEELVSDSNMIEFETGRRKVRDLLVQAGIPAFHSLSRAAKALTNGTIYRKQSLT
jgi:acyl-CoA synthetase (NDP forming)